jgi:hypothetical protein
MLSGQIIIQPQLPSEITSLETSVKIGGGTLHYKYSDGKVKVRLEDIDAEVIIIEGTDEDIDPAIFEGVQFCQPDPLESYPCFDTYYETALTY